MKKKEKRKKGKKGKRNKGKREKRKKGKKEKKEKRKKMKKRKREKRKRKKGTGHRAPGTAKFPEIAANRSDSERKGKNPIASLFGE